jgi:hypothetical protein
MQIFVPNAVVKIHYKETPLKHVLVSLQHGIMEEFAQVKYILLQNFKFEVTFYYENKI